VKLKCSLDLHVANQPRIKEKYWPLLTPTYEIGCKVCIPPLLQSMINFLIIGIQRRVFDNSKYVKCLQRDNVYLTDDPITALHPHSLLTKSGRKYPADVIVSPPLSLLKFITKQKKNMCFTETNLGCSRIPAPRHRLFLIPVQRRASRPKWPYSISALG
jgi:hypothetical protein